MRVRAPRVGRRACIWFLLSILVLTGAMPVVLAALTPAEQSALLAKHNTLRAAQSEPCTATNMRELVWEADLAAVAQNYAETCVWEHNGNRNTEAGYAVGENLCELHTDPRPCTHAHAT